MIRSKKIADYFPAKLADLRADEIIPFDVHLYFRLNSHIVVWRGNGIAPTEEFLKNSRDKHVDTLWVHKDDRKAYEHYMAHQSDVNSDEARSVEGALIAEVIRNPNLSNDEKEQIVQAAASEILDQATEPETREEQKVQNQDVKKIVNDVLEQTSDQAQGAISDILKTAQFNPDLQHAVNVSTYSVVFALAFGRIDPALLADLAMAGLLHDIGLAKVPFSVTRETIELQTDDSKSKYEGHVEAGRKYLLKYASEVSQRVQLLINQHHEQFSGEGYPGKLSQFEFDDIAQILAMSDLVETIGSGQFDGTPRSLHDSIAMVISMQNAKLKRFNPDIFDITSEWIQTEEAQKSIEEAGELVSKKMEEVTQ